MSQWVISFGADFCPQPLFATHELSPTLPAAPFLLWHSYGFARLYARRSARKSDKVSWYAKFVQPVSSRPSLTLFMASSPHPGRPRAGRMSDRRRAFFAVVLLAAAGLSGCQGITSTSAQLRVIDASPDAGVIDSYQNSSALAYNLGFGTMTSYIPMSPGVYNLAADKAGTRQTLVANNQTLAANHQYTEIIGAGLANLQQTFLADQSTPAPAGRIAIRVINQTTRSGAVDVYLVPFGRGTSTSPLAINLGFGANSGYIDLPEGTYAIDVVPTGTLLTSSTVTLLSGDQIAYASGAVRTIVLIDQAVVGTLHPAVNPGVQAIVAEDVEGQ